MHRLFCVTCARYAAYKNYSCYARNGWYMNHTSAKHQQGAHEHPQTNLGRFAACAVLLFDRFHDIVEWQIAR